MERPSLPALGPIGMASFIAALCVPPMLVGIGWLLLRRNSRSEARRFAATAQSMRAEAFALEQVLESVRRTLAESRAEVVEQSASLMMLGDAATGGCAASAPICANRSRRSAKRPRHSTA